MSSLINLNITLLKWFHANLEQTFKDMFSATVIIIHGLLQGAFTGSLIFFIRKTLIQ